MISSIKYTTQHTEQKRKKLKSIHQWNSLGWMKISYVRPLYFILFTIIIIFKWMRRNIVKTLFRNYSKWTGWSLKSGYKYPSSILMSSYITHWELIQIVFRCGEQNTIRDTYFCHLSGHNEEYNVEVSKKNSRIFSTMQISYWGLRTTTDRTEAIEIFLFLHFLYKSYMKSDTCNASFTHSA